VATASLGVTESVTRNLQPAPLSMHASLAAATVPPTENPPSVDPDLAREQKLREFQDALGNAWREGLTQATTAVEEVSAGPTGKPIPAAIADVPAPVASVSAAAAVAGSLAETLAPNPTAITSPSADAPTVAAITISTPTQTPTQTQTQTPTSTPDAPLPLLTAVPTAAADAGPQDLQLVVYSASWCVACQQAKAWMTAYSIPFEERDIDSSAKYVQELRSLNRRMTIPTFEIDGSVMVGFNPRRLVSILQRAVLRHTAGGAP
jgi:glutaredoxin